MGMFGQEHAKKSAVFTLNNASDFHEAFGTTPAIYNEETGMIEPLPADRDLEHTLLEYNQSVEPQFRFDLKDCTFEEVLKERDRAQEVYAQKAQGATGLLRKGVRFVGRCADQITPWIEFIPSDHGLGFLSAGLKIIFQIARQNADNQGKILVAFQDIPDLMLTVKDKQNQWNGAKALRTRAIELYETLARSLARLIFLLNGNMSLKPRSRAQFGKLIAKLAIPKHTGNAIDAILDKVKRQAGLFHQCLENVRDQKAIQTGADAAASRAATERIETGLNNLAQETRAHKDEVLKRLENQESGPAIMNSLNQIFVYYIQPPGAYSVEMIPPSLAQPSGPEPLLNEIELHDIVGVTPQCPSDDLHVVIKELPQFEVSTQAQAQQLFASRAFASWMAAPDPATLLVHGNFDIPGPGRTTALSVLCAILAMQQHKSSRNSKQPTIVLHHFCGLHGSRFNPADSTPGPSGLIRSLLAQMLHTGRRFNLDFINTRAFLHELQTHVLEQLCHTFSQLVEQLPRFMTVVCILDGLSEFSTQQWGDELVTVLLILDRLVTNTALRPTFKLLCTTPFARGGLVNQRLTAHYLVELQPPVEDDGYGFSERSLPHVVSQDSRSDYFRMRMQKNRDEEEENDWGEDDDSDDEEW